MFVCMFTYREWGGMYIFRGLQHPAWPVMKARQCKHNSRNMKRSGDSEGEKRRKVLIAFFSVSSGFSLSALSLFEYLMLHMWWCWLHFEAYRAANVNADLYLACFLYCVFHFPHSTSKKNYALNRYFITQINCREVVVACRITYWRYPVSASNTCISVCRIFVRVTAYYSIYTLITISLNIYKYIYRLRIYSVVRI